MKYSALARAAATFYLICACTGNEFALADETLDDSDLLTGNEYFDQAVDDWLDGTATKIVGGREAAEKQFPWQASIGVSYIADAFDAQYCGASILNDEWVITAAHCVDKVDAYRIKVTAGSNDLQGAPIRLNVKKVVVIEGYVRPRQGKDIALLQLNRKLTLNEYISPIALLREPSLIGQASTFTVTGWGQTTTQPGSKSATLRFIENIPYVPNNKCNRPLAYDNRVLDDMLCAGFDTAGVDSCKGDSGGPLTLYADTRPVLAGLVSWGDGCAQALRYGVHTRVANYVDWIDACINALPACRSKRL